LVTILPKIGQTLKKNEPKIGQKYLSKIGQSFCSKFKTSGEDDDDDEEEEDWWLLDQTRTE
jgi:hypothetical protein